MIDKEWPKVKEESEVYVKQMQRLMFYFVNIEDDEMRKEMVKFCANVYKISKQDNYKKKFTITLKHFNFLKEIYNNSEERDWFYFLTISRYISKIRSIALKDQAIEMVKMMGL